MNITKKSIKKAIPANAVLDNRKEFWNYFSFPNMTIDQLCQWRNEKQKSGELVSATLHQTMGPYYRPIIMVYDRPFAWVGNDWKGK